MRSYKKRVAEKEEKEKEKTPTRFFPPLPHGHLRLRERKKGGGKKLQRGRVHGKGEGEKGEKDLEAVLLSPKSRPPLDGEKDKKPTNSVGRKKRKEPFDAQSLVTL